MRVRPTFAVALVLLVAIVLVAAASFADGLPQPPGPVDRRTNKRKDVDRRKDIDRDYVPPDVATNLAEERAGASPPAKRARPRSRRRVTVDKKSTVDTAVVADDAVPSGTENVAASPDEYATYFNDNSVEGTPSVEEHMVEFSLSPEREMSPLVVDDQELATLPMATGSLPVVSHSIATLPNSDILPWASVSLAHASLAHDALEHCRHGRLEELQLMLAYTRVDLSANRDACFRKAAINGHVFVVQWLLSLTHRFYPSIGLVDPTANGNEAAMFAAYYGHNGVFEFLLQDWRVRQSIDSVKVLCWAINEKRTLTIDILFRHGVDINASRGKSRDVPFRLAVRSGNIAIIQRFIRHPQFAPVKRSVLGSLLVAAGNGNAAVLRVILDEMRMYIHQPMLKLGVIAAVVRGHLDCASILINDPWFDPSMMRGYEGVNLSHGTLVKIARALLMAPPERGVRLHDLPSGVTFNDVQYHVAHFLARQHVMLELGGRDDDRRIAELQAKLASTMATSDLYSGALLVNETDEKRIKTFTASAARQLFGTRQRAG